MVNHNDWESYNMDNPRWGQGLGSVTFVMKIRYRCNNHYWTWKLFFPFHLLFKVNIAELIFFYQIKHQTICVFTKVNFEITIFGINDKQLVGLPEIFFSLSNQNIFSSRQTRLIILIYYIWPLLYGQKWGLAIW